MSSRINIQSIIPSMHNSFFLIKDNYEPLQSPQLGQSNNFLNNFMMKG
jgi:hypothetical protein